MNSDRVVTVCSLTHLFSALVFLSHLTPRFHRVRLRRVTVALRSRYGRVTVALRSRYGRVTAATLVNGCYFTRRAALRLRSVLALGSAQNRIQVYL